MKRTSLERTNFKTTNLKRNWTKRNSLKNLKLKSLIIKSLKIKVKLKTFLLNSIQFKREKSITAKIMTAKIMTGAAVMLILLLFLCILTGCGNKNGKGDRITIVTREDGSGTRKAFVMLTGIQKESQDRTSLQAEVTNSNFVMMTSISGDENAIGYVSLGSLRDNVKAVKIDGVEPSAKAVQEGKYSLARSFYLIVREDISRAGEDFINYILSDEGQKVIEQQGYVGERTGNSYEAAEVKEGIDGEIKEEIKREIRGEIIYEIKGKVTIAGSTSAAPIMECLAKEYKKKNPKVTFEIQQTGSTAGIESVSEGVCDIGLASRELTMEEASRGFKEIRFARDGIAVIVNKNNPLRDISRETIAEIYMGHVTNWEDVY